MNTVETFTEDFTFDIVSSFVRKSLKSGGRLCPEEIVNALPVKKKNLENTDLMGMIRRLAIIIDETSDENIINVMKERKKEFSSFTDLKLTRSTLRASYIEVMRSWLISDGHELSWERVILVISFTSMLVNQTVACNQSSCHGRLRDLVSAASEFINTAMYPWISQNGHWSGLMACSKELHQKTFFDIPSTCTQPIVSPGQVNARAPEKLTSRVSVRSAEIKGTLSSCYDLSGRKTAIRKLTAQVCKPPAPSKVCDKLAPANEDESLQKIIPRDSADALVQSFYTPSEQDEELDQEEEPENLEYLAEEGETKDSKPREELSVNRSPKVQETKTKHLVVDDETVTHDVIVAFLLHNLEASNDAEHKIDVTLVKANQMLKGKTQDMKKSSIVSALANCAHSLVPAVVDSYHRVLKDCRESVRAMTDIRADSGDVWSLLDDMLFSWFIQDCHPMRWDRIIMTMEFLSDIVYKLCKKDNQAGFKRIRELVDMTVAFIQDYAGSQIESMGGWNNIIDAEHEFKQRTAYDVPNRAFLVSLADANTNNNKNNNNNKSSVILHQDNGL